MRITRFLATITCLTLFSLLYVYQQTEIVRLAYAGQKKIGNFEDLLDKNSVLRYNIGKSASLVLIGNKINESRDFQMPDTYRLVRLSSAKPRPGNAQKTPLKENLLVRIFGIKSQAEAKTINP